MKNTLGKQLSRKGFTLVELLVVIGVFSITGTIVVLILFATIRASKKTSIQIILKQNGNAAISQITKNVRYAKSMEYPSDCNPPFGFGSSFITVRSISNNALITFSCDGGASPTIASNGASLVDTSTVEVSSCSFYCSQASENDPPVINFGFSLSAKNSSGAIESAGIIPFRTSVIMRNLGK